MEDATVYHGDRHDPQTDLLEFVQSPTLSRGPDL